MNGAVEIDRAFTRRRLLQGALGVLLTASPAGCVVAGARPSPAPSEEVQPSSDARKGRLLARPGKAAATTPRGLHPLGLDAKRAPWSTSRRVIGRRGLRRWC